MRIQIINPKKTNTYFMPTKVYFGRNIVSNAIKLAIPKEVKKILLISGSHFKKSTNYINLTTSLNTFNLFYYKKKIKMSDFSSINSLVTYCRKIKFDAIIAIGGGTILDSAKCASILSIHDGYIEDYVVKKNKKLNKKGLFYIAIPTTAGTGSEVTPWASIWGDNKKKYSLYSKEYMFPNVAIVDAQLTDNLPSYETATSGIDALCQAIEAYWSRNYNMISDKYALSAIKLIFHNLATATNHKTTKSRDNMMLGSLKGGLAFSNTQTTICHALSYPLTSYWHIPHGQATTVTLPTFIKIILPLLDKKKRLSLLNVVDANDEVEAAGRIEKLMQEIGLKTKLKELGLSKKGINTVIKQGYHPDRMFNSPFVPSKNELKKILLTIYQ